MDLFINANTLTSNITYSIGSIILNFLKKVNKLNVDINITLIVDDESKLNQYNNLNKYNIISFKHKINSFKDFILKYLPWVYNKIEYYRPSYFWEPQTYLLRSFKHTKTIVTIHDLFSLEKVSKRSFYRKIIFKYFIKKTLENATFIQVPSNFTKDRINYFFNSKYESKIFVIYHGISNIYSLESNIKQQQNSKNDLVDERNFILFLGRISHWKGADFLLEVAEELYNKFKMKILLAGALGDRDLLPKIDYLEKKGFIKYLGFITEEQKLELLKKASIFVYPSRYDGFGMPPLEAILMGKKVLMSDIPVLREITKGLGVYFQVDNREDFFEKIKILLRNQAPTNIELIKHLKSLSWENFTKQFINNFINRE